MRHDGGGCDSDMQNPTGRAVRGQVARISHRFRRADRPNRSARAYRHASTSTTSAATATMTSTSHSSAWRSSVSAVWRSAGF